ncbi:hypothetical protein SAMN05444745_109129 [Arthrobacter sp. OV608]|nr:hypothetical protein SAMN05444745_109129 [Arthrobacter sp. OV608]
MGAERQITDLLAFEQAAVRDRYAVETQTAAKNVADNGSVEGEPDLFPSQKVDYFAAATGGKQRRVDSCVSKRGHHLGWDLCMRTRSRG